MTTKLRSILATVAAIALAACNDNTTTFVDDSDAAVDSRIFGVLATANQGEVDVASVFLERGQTPEAVSFAEQMLAEHSAALDRGAELAARLGLLPATSDTSARLAAMTDQTIATLDATSEFQIDVVYMDSQIQMHAEVLRIIDQELLPNATAFELRDELVRTRAAVAAHLDEAQAVRDDLFVFTGMAKR